MLAALVVIPPNACADRLASRSQLRTIVQCGVLRSDANSGGLKGAISASYSYFNALIGSTRDARCAGMKPAHSATSASATAESASTAGSAPVI